VIENIIVRHSAWVEADPELLFGDETVHFTDASDLPGLLVELGIYKSKSDSRRAGREGPIPLGWTHELKVSKTRRLWIWNPTE